MSSRSGVARDDVRVDRTRCAGRGVCAELLPDQFSLDEWGYPIQSQVLLPRWDAADVVAACPVRALYQARNR